MSSTSDYTKYSSVQLKKLVSMRKIPERSFITRKDQMIKALKKYDENPNDIVGLKKYMKILLHPSETGENSTQFLTLSQFDPSQELFSNFGGDDTQSMLSDFTTASDLSMLPDVVPTEIQYPNLKSLQTLVKLEMPKNDYDVLVKMVDDYEKMKYKKQIYEQTSKNKKIIQRNLLYNQEGKFDKVKPLIEEKPFVKQMTLDKYIVKY
jgi:hypothetical protein